MRHATPSAILSTLVACWLAVVVCPPALAMRTDKVTLVNGDVITGEIKGMDHGLMRFKTDSMDTVQIQWEDVVRLTSVNSFQIELEDGDFFFGALTEAERDYSIKVAVGEFVVDLDMAEVIQINRIKEKFWASLDGSISLGFSFTRASDVAQLSFNGSAQLRKRKYFTSLSLNAINTTQSEEPTTSRTDLTYRYDRILEHAWITGGSFSVQSNDELGLDRRFLITGVGGKQLVQTNRQLLLLQGGLAVNNETQLDGEMQTTLEAIMFIGYEIFKYKSPKTSLNSKLSFFPSLTSDKRYRVQYDISARQEVVKDFFFELSGYFTFDSQPPENAASGTDYGIVTSLGWTF